MRGSERNHGLITRAAHIMMSPTLSGAYMWTPCQPDNWLCEMSQLKVDNAVICKAMAHLRPFFPKQGCNHSSPAALSLLICGSCRVGYALSYKKIIPPIIWGIVSIPMAIGQLLVACMSLFGCSSIVIASPRL